MVSCGKSFVAGAAAWVARVEGVSSLPAQLRLLTPFSPAPLAPTLPTPQLSSYHFLFSLL